MNIRPATSDDIPAIARLHVEGWKGAYGGIINQGYLDSLTIPEREEQWRAWFDPENAPLFIAMDSNAPAGFVSCGKLRTPPPGSSPIRPLYSAEIYALYLLPDYYRRGIGRALMREAAQALSEKRHKSLCLWVLEKNERGCAFYKALGGERCGKKDVSFGPTTAREVCFGWRDSSVLT